MKSETRSRLLLFFFVLSIVGPLVHPYMAQQASRYALTAAIWDNHSVRLDGLESVLGIDHAVREGHTYSDKAPLQPVVAVPFYAAYRAVGGEPATELRIDRNLGLWWQTLWFAAIPLALLAVLMLALAQRVDRQVALPAALSVAVGTILLPFGSLLFGHVLGGLCIVAALALILTDEVTTARLIGSGALFGAAVATEYPVVLAGVAIGVFVVWKVRWRFYWFVLGGLPLAALLGGYHAMAFGSPLAHPYTFSAFAGVVEEQQSFFATFSGLSLDNLTQMFFAGRGFLIASPVVILGLAGLIWEVRRSRHRERALAAVSLGVFLGLMLVPLYWDNPWGGDSPGPRYLAPALPLLVVGVAAAWSHRPLLTRAAVGLSVLTMVVATITNPLALRLSPGGLGTWIDLALAGEFVDTIFTMALGAWGWLLHGGLVAVLGWVLYRDWADDDRAGHGSAKALAS